MIRMRTKNGKYSRRNVKEHEQLRCCVTEEGQAPRIRTYDLPPVDDWKIIKINKKKKSALLTVLARMRQ